MRPSTMAPLEDLYFEVPKNAWKPVLDLKNKLCAQTRCIPTHFDTSTKVKSAAVRQILFKFWENLLTLKGHFRRNETELEVCYFFLLDTTSTVFKSFYDVCNWKWNLKICFQFPFRSRVTILVTSMQKSPAKFYVNKSWEQIIFPISLNSVKKLSKPLVI